MLRGIGLGICLIVSSELFNLALYFVFTNHFAWNGSHTTFTNSEDEVSPVGEWLMLLSYFVRDVSMVIVGSITL